MEMYPLNILVGIDDLLLENQHGLILERTLFITVLMFRCILNYFIAAFKALLRVTVVFSLLHSHNCTGLEST